MFCTEVKSNIFPTETGSLHVNVVLISFIFTSVSVPAALWATRGSVNMKCGKNVTADENTHGQKKKNTQG